MINYDKLGERFNAFKEIGEETRMLIGNLSDSSSMEKVGWVLYDHQDVDGVGMIVSELEKKVKVKSVPIMKNPKRPGFLKLILLFFRYMKWATGEKPIWNKTYDWDIVGGPEFSFIFRFSKDDTTKIHRYCKKNQISTTSFFLSHADKAFQNNVLDIESRKWVVPINIRGITDRIVEKRNLSVVCQVWLNKKGDNHAYIHNRIKTFLQNGLHWGGWLSLVIQSFLSKKTLIKILDKHRNIAHGLFTNIGRWPADFIDGDFPESLVICIPSSRLMPISCLMLEFHDRIQLNLSLHPVLGVTKEQSQECLKEWIKNCLNELNLVGEEPIIEAIPIKQILRNNGSLQKR